MSRGYSRRAGETSLGNVVYLGAPPDSDPIPDVNEVTVTRTFTTSDLPSNAFGSSFIYTGSSSSLLGYQSVDCAPRPAVQPEQPAYQAAESTVGYVHIDKVARRASAVVAATAAMSLGAFWLSGVVLINPVISAVLLIGAIAFFLMSLIKS